MKLPRRKPARKPPSPDPSEEEIAAMAAYFKQQGLARKQAEPPPRGRIILRPGLPRVFETGSRRR